MKTEMDDYNMTVRILEELGLSWFHEELHYWGHANWSNATYNLTLTSFTLGLFGWTDGQANAFPKGGLM